MNNENPILSVRGLVKNYGRVAVLKELTLEVHAGEVRALMGVNGAGKSTLVNILGGITPATAGSVTVSGAPFAPSSPEEASAAGIAIVHQELSLVPGLSVAENITLGRWTTRGLAGLGAIDGRRIRELATRALSQLGESIPLSTLVEELPPAQQQLVEIAKALVTDPRILILDEPTSSLAAHEVNVLIRLVRRLADQGVAVIYVSHRMDEIPQVADTVSVLRDGREVATESIANMGTARIASLMLGKELATRSEVVLEHVGEPLLEVEGLDRRGAIDNVSLKVHKGEVVGIVGLMGSGRTEILRAIFGLDRSDGVVKMHGQAIRRNPDAMIRAGVGFTPEDRKEQGLALGLSVSANLVLTCFERIRNRFGYLSAAKERAIAKRSVETLSIATPDIAAEAGQLSGGNQQKIVIGKWLNRGVDVLLMDEPTRGVDVHAKNQTYDTIIDIAKRGGGVLFVSSEVEEVFLVCNRVLVVRGGRIVADIPVHETTSEQVLALSMMETEPEK